MQYSIFNILYNWWPQEAGWRFIVAWIGKFYIGMTLSLYYRWATTTLTTTKTTTTNRYLCLYLSKRTHRKQTTSGHSILAARLSTWRQCSRMFNVSTCPYWEQSSLSNIHNLNLFLYLLTFAYFRVLISRFVFEKLYCSIFHISIHYPIWDI